MKHLVASLLLSAVTLSANAQLAGRVPVKSDLFSSTIPAGPEWTLLESSKTSLTYQWQDQEHLRSWNIQLTAVTIKPSETRAQLIREFEDASRGMRALPESIDGGRLEILPAKKRRYLCVEGVARPSLNSAKPMMAKSRLAMCRHPKYPFGAVAIMMSVGGRTGDDPELDGFDQMIDDLVMH
ncbi:hypothetical protein ACQ859_20525 [Roseateles chitinivorans]|uniref:hypothetical protein n=1 Tax=Roseateles chitinivorans TaxID=2917965 RepID=UPI003D67A84F